MGCGGSSERVIDNSGPELNKTDIKDVDDMFDEIYAPVMTLHKIHKGLTKTLEDLKMHTGTVILKNHKIEDSIEGLLLCLLASVDGEIDRLGLTLLKSSPYLTFNRSTVAVEHQPMVEAWDRLANFTLELPDQLAKLGEQAKKIFEDAIDIGKKAGLLLVDQTRVLQMNAFSQMKEAKKINRASAIITMNSAKLVKAPKAFEECRNCFNEALAAITSLVSRVESESEKNRLKQLAKVAFAAKLVDPKRIIETVWQDKTRIVSHPLAK